MLKPRREVTAWVSKPNEWSPPTRPRPRTPWPSHGRKILRADNRVEGS